MWLSIKEFKRKIIKLLLNHCYHHHFNFHQIDLMCCPLWHLSVIFFQQYISGHFDTKVGAKTEPKSYKAISEIIHTKPSRILFVTDVTKGKFWLSYFPFWRLFFAISYDIGKNVNNLFIVEVQLAIKLGHRYSSLNDLKETIIIII